MKTERSIRQHIRQLEQLDTRDPVADRIRQYAIATLEWVLEHPAYCDWDYELDCADLARLAQREIRGEQIK